MLLLGISSNPRVQARANVLGELGCMCVAAHQNTLSLLRYALLSDRHRRAMSCCFIAVGQSYRVPLQASQSSLFMKLIKVAGSGPSFRTAWVTSDGKDSSVLEKVLLLVQSVIYFLSSLQSGTSFVVVLFSYSHLSHFHSLFVSSFFLRLHLSD